MADSIVKHAVEHALNLTGLSPAERINAALGVMPGWSTALQRIEVIETLMRPPTRIDITLQNGAIQSVFSPDDCTGIRVVSIDYDTDGADDSELSLVPQDNGDLEEAIVVDRDIEKAPWVEGRALDDLLEFHATATFANRHGDLDCWSETIFAPNMRTANLVARKRLMFTHPYATKVELKVYR